jgi:3-hydroxyacyl-CoA dehydrogenase/enoyl-CoA hydratase/3-hydroxybutyryl-CoA epimerase
MSVEMAARAPAQPLPSRAHASVAYVPIDEHGVGRIVIDRSDDPVNSIDVRLVEDLAAAVAAARVAKPRGLVVESAKPGQFVAGADLSLLDDATSADVERASRALQRVLNDLESLPFPVVAAIGGPALGGGLEIALACDARVAADAPSVRLGLTEVRLGLLPAAGGTQRLPRLVGLPRALDLILAGRQLSAKRALRAGLVDEVVHPAVLARAAADRALRATKARPAGGRTVQERALTWTPLRALALRRARASVMAETKGLYPAPLRAIDAIATGLARGIDAGLDAEARAFGELAFTPAAKSLVRLLFLTLRQRRAALEGLGASDAPSGARRAVDNVAVVGLGFMGSGIAQAAAAAGMRVRVRDRDAAAVAKGLRNIQRLTLDASRKGVFERREAARITGRITGGADLSGFGTADLVIEAVFEDLETKRRVIAELERVVRDDAVIASNTSALPISEIASAAARPERIVGMHFFSPVHRMQLIEVVRPKAADPDAVVTAVSAAIRMGKTPIVVGDGPGFYTTRVLSTMIADAFALLAEGVAIDEIDRAMTAFGWPVGPLQLVDEVGLEVAGHAGETVARARGMEPPKIVAALVAEGKKGKGRGGGFYRYDGKTRAPDPRVYEILRVAPMPAHEDVAERLTRTFVVDALRCLDEGILRSAEEGDLGAVLGLGFPPYLGGPFAYARAKGITGPAGRIG